MLLGLQMSAKGSTNCRNKKTLMTLQIVWPYRCPNFGYIIHLSNMVEDMSIAKLDHVFISADWKAKLVWFSLKRYAELPQIMSPFASGRENLS